MLRLTSHMRVSVLHLARLTAALFASEPGSSDERPQQTK